MTRIQPPIGAIAAAAAASGLTSKLITATFDLSTASGTIGYGTTTFTPSVIFGLGALSSNTGTVSSMGFSDSGTTYWELDVTYLGQKAVRNDFLGFNTLAGAAQELTISSYTPTGFIGQWTKTGSPTGTLQLAFLCLK